MADGKKAAGTEAAMGWGILACVFAAIGWLVWHNFHDQIRNVIRWLRYGEMSLMAPIVGANYAVTVKGEPIRYQELMRLAKTTPAEAIDNEFLGILSQVAMTPYLVVFIAIAAGFAFWALFKGPGSEHRGKYDINTLIKKQSNIFPIIKPFIDFNPSDQPPRAPGAPVPDVLPIFAEALSPEEWIVFNEVPVIDKKLDEDLAGKSFAKQLGARWRGAKSLTPYRQVMLAAFCLKAARKRADCDTLLGRLAACWSEKDGLQISRDKSLLREARSVLNNQGLAGKVLRKCNEHAWETTAIMRALATAREEGGVLAPAQFVWLRAYDRTLWYPLNNLGRQSFHMEAIGAMTHYKAEKLAQRPIPRPKIADAVKTIVEYLDSGKARPLPPMEYSNKKRGIKKPKAA